MDESETGFAAGSAVRAIRFPTTARAVREMGGPRLPLAFWVVADPQSVDFIHPRASDRLWGIPSSSVLSISVAETESQAWRREVALAIVMTVRTGGEPANLPIVPVSDDGKRSLTWKDREVRILARRLSYAMGRPR